VIISFTGDNILSPVIISFSPVIIPFHLSPFTFPLSPVKILFHLSPFTGENTLSPFPFHR